MHDTKKAPAGRAARAEAKAKATKAAKHQALPVGASTQGEALFPYSLLHLGGDEVSYTCWEQSPEVSAVCYCLVRMF